MDAEETENELQLSRTNPLMTQFRKYLLPT